MRGVLIATLALGCACAQQPPKADPVELRAKDKEAFLGAHLAEEFRKRFQIVENAPVQAYVETLGKCLAAKMSGDAVPFTFAVIMNDAASMHEPVTLPGGYIFVPARLFVAAETESEFAGMLAHSMAHVVRRHASRTTKEGEAVDLPRGNLAFVIFDEAVMPIAYARLNRPLEMEADRDAARALGAAGFDPAAVGSYVSRLQVDDATRKYPASRYPPREERLAELAKITPTVSVEPGSCNTDFLAIREEVRQMLVRPKRPVPSLMKPPVK